eukprot:4859060-Amphidinium_carterae.1
MTALRSCSIKLLCGSQKAGETSAATWELGSHAGMFAAHMSRSRKSLRGKGSMKAPIEAIAHVRQKATLY